MILNLEESTCDVSPERLMKQKEKERERSGYNPQPKPRQGYMVDENGEILPIYLRKRLKFHNRPLKGISIQQLLE